MLRDPEIVGLSRRERGRRCAGVAFGVVGAIENPFAVTEAAQRYHVGRPYHHRRTLGRVLDAVTVGGDVAIDVAAGTGLSTHALAALGFRAVGVEPVEAMLGVAREWSLLPYVVGTAEALPIGSHVASLLTVSSAIHWFDRRPFFAEAQRILTADGVIAIYEHAGLHLPDDDTFVAWICDEYLERYPTPPRGAIAGTTEEPEGLRRIFHDRWIDTVDFSHEQLVAYMMTQSNIVDAIEAGHASDETTRGWLTTSTARFFDPLEQRSFGFHVLAEALQAV